MSKIVTGMTLMALLLAGLLGAGPGGGALSAGGLEAAPPPVGVTPSLTSDLAASLGLREVRGALVSSVSEGGPADNAGVERGDVVVSVDGVAVADGNALRNRIASTRPGSTVTLGLLRDGRERAVRVALREAPGERAVRASTAPSGGGRLGLAVRPVTPDDARRLGVSSGRGLLVAEVDPAGPAAVAGLQPGDVIEEVNHKPVAEAGELSAAVAAAPDRPSLVLVNRSGESLYLTLEGPRA